ncbi:unnamed protein product [Periconia digitata]|uniref:VWFA domain-containing protein n=1 Tax=Periconia digitata TaxID=1303443 RepID=A0A9W4U7F8_9PLEO|nr:unnamed protein product [Periconia digitata]
MASQQCVAVSAPPSIDFYPLPLHIRRKSPEAAFYSQIDRKLTSPPLRNNDGPLDDIIKQISCELLTVPYKPSSARSSCGSEDFLESLLGWQDPSDHLLSHTVLPLPVSRRPSNQPLIVRKHRNSRSTASSSCLSNTMGWSLGNSRKESTNTSNSSANPRADSPPPSRPLASDPNVSESNPAAGSDHARLVPGPRAPRNDDQNKESTSRNRLFSWGLSRFRRSHTDDVENDEPAGARRPIMIEHLRPAPIRRPMIDVTTGVILNPLDSVQSRPEGIQERPVNPGLVSTLGANICITPADRMILHKTPVHEMWAAVEVQGVLHNGMKSADETVDVAFIIDISYYVGKNSLALVKKVIVETLDFLNPGDRIAVYATHCTHGAGTDTIPDMLCSLRAVNDDTKRRLGDVLSLTEKNGTQKWFPPRPNPSTTNVVLAVAKSLEMAANRKDRTHVIMLSPTVGHLHNILPVFPRLRIHQINVAILPYLHIEDPQEKPCNLPCCKNVSVNGWQNFELPTYRIKQIIHFARSAKPIGDLTNLKIVIEAKKGCEVLTTVGATHLETLKLGQTHTVFVRVRITLQDTDELDLESSEAFWNSSLNASYFREDLGNTKAKGDSIAHVLSVALMNQSSLQPLPTWNYTEAQMAITMVRGEWEYLGDSFMDLQHRLIFHYIRNSSIEEAKTKIDLLGSELENEFGKPNGIIPDGLQSLRHMRLTLLIGDMAREIDRQAAVREYELKDRQKIPSYPNQVRIATTPHHSLAATFEGRHGRRHGMIF